MYTAQELIEAVRNNKEVAPIMDNSPYRNVNSAIIANANKGWLCLNASRYIYVTRDVVDYYRSLGYRIDKDGIIYWIYN